MRATTKFVAVIVATCGLMCPTILDAQPARRPSWASLPSGDDLAQAYPRRALNLQVNGRAILTCRAGHGGALDACRVGAEDPPLMGFGEAALGLAGKFRIDTSRPETSPPPGSLLRIPVRFIYPGAAPPERALVYPGGGSAVTRDSAYWPSAAEADAQAVVLMNCHVDGEGRLRPCVTHLETVEGLGFKEAAQKLILDGAITAGPPSAGGPAPADGVWRFQVVFAGGGAPPP